MDARNLIKVDRLTLQIIVMKMQGYSTHDIASLLGMTSVELLDSVLADTQTPQLLFLGFFPEPPFLFFSAIIE